ncbi:hypothetical protein F5X99DRAFT_431951 [Biscogniauxia marginata]|nr:hypothetical protein F5X99DRAFT_431951 [Biscogniauxia marginata]
MTASFESKESHSLLADTAGVSDYDGEKCHIPSSRSSWCRCQKLLLGLLSSSLIANLILITLLFHHPAPAPPDQPSRYAGLQLVRSEPYVRVTKYSSPNETFQEQLWRDISVDAGVVALPDAWAAGRGLRAAQRFPWDPSKGVYILHGYHNLHCLKVIRLSVGEYRRGAPQSRSWRHVSHCFDALRRQVLCDADDTPRATERRAEVVSGLLQHRRCRSWEELEGFARAHTACYRRPEDPESEEGRSVIDRFKHCPPDSGYVVRDDYVPSDEFLVGLPEESLEDP